ncbi:hypothetical protein AAVH_17733, partial [Aphelenchoides avenae]
GNRTESLEQEFELTKAATSEAVKPFQVDQTVSHYGDVKMSAEPVGFFLGDRIRFRIASGSHPRRFSVAWSFKDVLRRKLLFRAWRSATVGNNAAYRETISQVAAYDR